MDPRPLTENEKRYLEAAGLGPLPSPTPEETQQRTRALRHHRERRQLRETGGSDEEIAALDRRFVEEMAALGVRVSITPRD